MTFFKDTDRIWAVLFIFFILFFKQLILSECDETAEFNVSVLYGRATVSTEGSMLPRYHFAPLEVTVWKYKNNDFAVLEAPLVVSV